MRRIWNITIAAAVATWLMPSFASAEVHTFDVDPVHSHVGFKVRHLLGNTPGEFNAFAGTVSMDPEAIETTLAFSGTAQTASIDTDDEKRDDHLRSADFFAVDKHPEMTLVSKSVTKDGDGYHVLADLTLLGVTREVPLHAVVNGVQTNPFTGTPTTGLEITGVVKRKDFGMEWNKTLDTGGLLLGEDVKLDIQLEATVAPEKKES